MKQIISKIVKKTGTTKYGRNKDQNYEMFKIYFKMGSEFAVGGSTRQTVVSIFSSEEETFSLLNSFPSKTEGGITYVDLKSDEFTKYCEEHPHFKYFGTDLVKVDRANRKVEYDNGCIRFCSRNVRIDGKPESDPSEPIKYYVDDVDGEHITRRDQIIIQDHVIITWREIYDLDESISSGEDVWRPINGGSTPEEAIRIELENQRGPGGRFVPILVDNSVSPEENDDHAPTAPDI